MNSFTPGFLADMGGVSPLAPIIDNAILEDMIHGGGLMEHLTDNLMDKGYNRPDARQNAEVLEGFILSGAFSTSLSRSQLNLAAV
jgi:hypothetical protein